MSLSRERIHFSSRVAFNYTVKLLRRGGEFITFILATEGGLGIYRRPQIEKKEKRNIPPSICSQYYCTINLFVFAEGRRRTPTHFNSVQRDILEAYYKYDNFPDPSEQLHLSEYLRVPYSVIKTWFQNTRKNHRKHLKESCK